MRCKGFCATTGAVFVRLVKRSQVKTWCLRASVWPHTGSVSSTVVVAKSIISRQQCAQLWSQTGKTLSVDKRFGKEKRLVNSWYTKTVLQRVCPPWFHVFSVLSLDPCASLAPSDETPTRRSPKSCHPSSLQGRSHRKLFTPCEGRLP